MSPLAVAHLEQLDLVRDRRGTAPLGLDVHLPGAAEAVEVVDVQRAEINLQRAEHVAGLTPIVWH